MIYKSKALNIYQWIKASNIDNRMIKAKENFQKIIAVSL